MIEKYLKRRIIFPFLTDGELHDFVVERVINPIRNAKQQAENNSLPFVLWWTPHTLERGTIKRCHVGDCYFTQNRSLAIHPQMKSFLFYGSNFKKNDLPLPRESKNRYLALSSKNNSTIELLSHSIFSILGVRGSMDQLL